MAFSSGTSPSISFLELIHWWPAISFGEFAAVPVVVCVTALAINLVASLVLSHSDIDGSPSFCVKGNAMTQALAIVPCAAMGLRDGGFAWLGGAVDTSPDSWGNYTLWFLLAICVKDIPWLVAYGHHLILVHHLTCIAGIVLFTVAAPPTGHLFVVGSAFLEASGTARAEA